MVSTGMQIGALHTNKLGMPGLRLGDIKKIEEFGLYMIWVYSWSKADRYYTFCTPECAATIDAYLNYRRSFGEELKDKSPLIMEQFNIDNPFTVRAPKFLSQRMMSFVDDVLKCSGVNQHVNKASNERRDVMRSDGFCKFFINQCDKANLNYAVREYLSGHKVPNQDPSYIRKSEEDRFAEFVKAIQDLTISQEQLLKRQVHKLQTEQYDDIDELHRQWLIKMQEQYAVISLSSWNALKEEMEKLKKYILPIED
jgi:hypothetical protein